MITKDSIKYTLIHNYLNQEYKLVDWIIPHIDKLNWTQLSSNPNSFDFIFNEYEKNQMSDNIKKVNWYEIAKNPNATKLIIKIIKDPYDIIKIQNDKIFWEHLCLNTNKIILLEIEKMLDNKEKNKIDFFNLSRNTSDKAIEILIKNKDKINWDMLSQNSNNNAIKLLEENEDKIVINNLVLNTNPKAIELVKKIYYKNPEIFKEHILINLIKNPSATKLILELFSLDDLLYFFSQIKNKKSMEILEEKLEKININNQDFWNNLASNEYAIKLLNKYEDKIIDTSALAFNTNPKVIDLIKKKYYQNPENFDKHNTWYILSKNPIAIDFLKEHQEKINTFIKSKYI